LTREARTAARRRPHLPRTPHLRLAEDAFNLYGLRSLVPHFKDALEMILDSEWPIYRSV